MRRGFVMRLALGLVLGIAFGSQSVRADDYYYAVVFGSQTHPKMLRYSHTWATFVRLSGEGPDLSTYTMQVHTISWLPKSLKVHVFDPRPEPGVNLDLQATINTMYAEKQNITCWGPFQIQQPVYERSLAVASILNAGQAEYRAISGSGNILVADCIHAVAAVDPVFGRDHYPLIRIGKPASRFLARQIILRSPIDQVGTDNSWLIPALGIDRYPIEIVSPRQIPKQECFFCKIPE
jgi:hypothetical protein